MRFFLTFLVLVAIALAVIIAFDDEQHLPADPSDDSDESTTDTTPGDSPDSAAIPVPRIDTSAERDPREVLVDLIHESNGNDLELIYDHLPERFRVLDFDEGWVRVVDPRRRAGYIRSSEALNVEAYDGYAIVRTAERAMASWVFVVEDGEWRYDPGDRFLLMASAQVAQGDRDGFSYGMAAPDDYQARSRSEPDDGSVSPLVRGRLHGVGVYPGNVDISMVWEFEFGRSDPDAAPVQSHLLSDVTIPLDRISWHVGEDSGGVEVRWTDAVHVNGQISLPGWSSEERAAEASGDPNVIRLLDYGMTLRLVGVPEYAEEILLRFETVEVGPFGEDGPVPAGETVTYTWEFTVPARTTDPIMVGEPPDPAPSDDPIASQG